MQFELIPVVQDVTPRFEIEVVYEHGDADHSDSSWTTIQSSDLKDLEAYMALFDDLSQSIHANRTQSQDFPEKFNKDITRWEFNFQVDIKGEPVYIEIERDATVAEDLLYFAEMTIMQVFYYDENGKKFNVSFWR